MQGAPPRVRRLRAADQGPLDWLVPFIPPVLRVDRETRIAICQKAAELQSKETLQNAALAIRPYWRSLAFYGLLVAVWVRGLTWVHHNEPEFAVAYVILSGFAALGVHLLSGDSGRTDGMSAYSIFNQGAQRMLGSLSAEQFENEIRHRQPHENLGQEADNRARNGLGDSDGDEDEDDPDLVAALRLSLQKQKREARRARRTRKK